MGKGRHNSRSAADGRPQLNGKADMVNLKLGTALTIGLVALALASCYEPEQRSSPGYASPAPGSPRTRSSDQPMADESRRRSEPWQIRAAVPAPQPLSGRDESPDLLTLLEGCVIVANDGQFLGKITTNQFDSKSIINEYGEYGNPYSSTSIFNKYNNYGNEYSSLSPFNDYTTTPPQVICPDGHIAAYLTTNQFKTPALNPHVLIGLLRSRP
jgi:hypothetical protein